MKDLACLYLLDEIRGYGYEPFVQSFLLGVDRASLTGLEVSPGGDSLWVAEIDGSVYLATAAAGWDDPRQMTSIEGEVHDLELDPAGRLWAACGLPNGNLGEIRRSADGGMTWESIYSGQQVLSIYDIEIEGDNAVAVGSYGTVLIAVFGGQAWGVADPAVFRYQSLYGAAASGPGHFWLVTMDGSLFETPDLGARWFESDLAARPLHAIDFFGPRHGVIVGDRISFHTADGGATWTEAPAEADLRHVSMADSERVLAGGAAGELYYSGDGGASWSGLECGGGEQVYRTAASGDGLFWAAGGNELRRIEDTAPLDCAVYLYNDTIMGSNISFLHEGGAAPERRILMTAHYDSYSADYDECAPGADDNATGVSAVLQAARALRGSSTEKSVEFVLFDGEELGLKGSSYFASTLDPDVEYEAVVNLDMLGYDHGVDRSLLIAGREENAADSLIAELIIGAAADLGLEIYPFFAPGAALSSDHRSFWSMEMPSILLIEGYREELTPRYHTCYDIADFIDYT
ncbi:MAG TPA: M28 family peptidase, partial [Candidatus Eisenbacteria bacterium]|nr:M28 family peptidase [Candidatus Eisenbacteria bacterium]